MCVSKLCVNTVCEDKLCEGKLCVDKLCECEDKLCEDKVCVSGRRRRRREEAEAEAEGGGGIQNQKQEPHTKMWGKKQCFANCYLFARLHLLSSASFSSLIFFFFFCFCFCFFFFSLLFSSLPTSAFSSVHIIVGGLTSKLTFEVVALGTGYVTWQN